MEPSLTVSTSVVNEPVVVGKLVLVGELFGVAEPFVVDEPVVVGDATVVAAAVFFHDTGDTNLHPSPAASVETNHVWNFVCQREGWLFAVFIICMAAGE